MLHFAMCDDEAVEIEYLTSLVKTWAASKNLDISIATFNSAETFLFAYEDMKDLDILLLDIQMGGMDGMDLARQLRKSNEDAQIIFITGFADFMADGYDVSALHYLMKPVKEERLFAVLDKAAAGVDVQEAELLVQTANGAVKVAHKDILYLEAFAHYIQIYTKTGALETRANLGDIATALGDGFVRCHRSYVVGLRHVNHMTKADVVLDSGTAVPLSRRMGKDVNLAFIKFHSKGRGV